MVIRYLRVVAIGFATILFCKSAESKETEARVRNVIFGEPVLRQNAVEVARASQLLPPSERFDQLSRWISGYPADGRLRVTADLTEFQSDVGQAEVSLAADPLAVETWADANRIISPFQDWVEVAHAIDKLDQVAEAIDAWLPVDQEQSHQQAVARCLVAIKREDVAAVGELVDRLFSWPDRGVKDRGGAARRLDWMVVQQIALNEAMRPLISEELLHWVAGDGEQRVDAHFRSLRSTSGHRVDEVVFASPMAGRYEVNAEVTTLPGHWASLQVAGTQTPLPSRSQRQRMARWTHLRCRVDEKNVEHFVNGQSVGILPRLGDTPSWVGIRSTGDVATMVRNLTITGEPEIPATVDLLETPRLIGWNSYHDLDRQTETNQWKLVSRQNETVLRAETMALPPNSFAEDLFRYERPMTDAGMIEYEFWYHPNTATVAPAVGRQVFQFDGDGVYVHQLTDGRHEQSWLRPDNRRQLGQADGVTQAPKLVPDQFNRVRLRFTSDELQISVNDDEVLRCKLPATDSRVFGFFRFADQHQATVRRVRMSGSWPTELPSMADQPLASKEIIQLNRSAEQLDDVRHFDLRGGIHSRQFDFYGDQTTMRAVDDGMRMMRTFSDGVREMRTCIRVDGDFDITADYADLQVSDVDPTWHCGIGLAIHLNDTQRNYFAIHRRRDRLDGRHYVAFVRKEMNDGGKTAYIGSEQTPDFSSDGRLRLARRGDTIYALHANGDSTAFRLIATETVSDAPIEIQGLRCITETGKGMETSVTWKHLSVRGNIVDTLSVDDEAKTIAKLNRSFKESGRQVTQFAAEQAPDADIAWTGLNDAQIAIDSSGAVATVGDGDNKTRSYLYRTIDAGQQFDVKIELDILDFPRAPAMGAANEITLQVLLRPPSQPQPAFQRLDRAERQVNEASLLLRHKANGLIELVPRTVGTNRVGQPQYRPIRSIAVHRPDQFRITLHDQILYFLYSESDSDDEHVAATYPVDGPLVPDAVLLGVIATDGSPSIRARWKSCEVGGDHRD